MQTITLEQEQILPAPSNSRLSVHNLPIYPKTPIQELPQEIEKVSIDKLVIAANLNPYLVQSLIAEFCNEPNITFQGDRSSSHFSNNHGKCELLFRGVRPEQASTNFPH